jgi:hypothetical protein
METAWPAICMISFRDSSLALDELSSGDLQMQQ